MERGYFKHEIAIPETSIRRIYDGDTYVGMVHPHWFQRRPDCAGTWVGFVSRDEPGVHGPIYDEDDLREEKFTDRKFATAEAAEAEVRALYARR